LTSYRCKKKKKFDCGRTLLKQYLVPIQMTISLHLVGEQQTKPKIGIEEKRSNLYYFKEKEVIVD
jgi:hypothetical protein